MAKYCRCILSSVYGDLTCSVYTVNNLRLLSYQWHVYFCIEDHMLDWHSCQTWSPLEIKLLLLLWNQCFLFDTWIFSLNNNPYNSLRIEFSFTMTCKGFSCKFLLDTAIFGKSQTTNVFTIFAFTHVWQQNNRRKYAYHGNRFSERHFMRTTNKRTGKVRRIKNTQNKRKRSLKPEYPYFQLLMRLRTVFKYTKIVCCKYSENIDKATLRRRRAGGAGWMMQGLHVWYWWRTVVSEQMSQLMRLWYLSHRRTAKAQVRLRAHIKYGSRRRIW